MENLLDIVNEQDEVIGRATAQEIHAKLLHHRVAAVFVFCGDKLLVQQRARVKDGLLDHSVGGHVDAGEFYEKAAAREMQEEIGLEVSLQFVGRVPGADRRNHVLSLFEVEIDNVQFESLEIDMREMEELIPMTLEEVSQKMNENPAAFTDGFLSTFNFYVTKKGLSIPLVPRK
ncbi:MAG: hypothetical protein COU11_02260 [Candidatus Harrisonbacteria bacterium CG10_big_fil_rev_8_21_14_0_10_49_15]|uniref:Nudix hydrolase domain-containing protein n=1 Tax=Candidatus Harrisonbacteria bacterium CG10_big_fil_rev_8_21_14_0_10_49_15 TaxID=1974587 RepID=A0A2H0UKV8_9BACT|nr:MAG: hypothetical protein COU11_02260 [Candidatus Harrisonbacteria bacterium CG10_big_fil_rev_8_21_14_0_10_49_15]